MLLAGALAACGGSDGGDGPAPAVPRLAPAAVLSISRPGSDLVFDATRNRIYVSEWQTVVAINPDGGAQTVLVGDAADAPAFGYSAGAPSQIALSRNGNFLFIAASSGQLVRYNLNTQQVDLRLDPPAAVAANLKAVRVVASPLEDRRAFVLFEPGESYSAQQTAALATVVDAEWAPEVLELGGRLPPPPAAPLAATDYGIWISPDGDQILYGPGPSSKRITVAGQLPVSYTTFAMPVSSHRSTPPQFTAHGVLWNGRLFDSVTFAPGAAIPGAIACVTLPVADRLACIGPSGPEGNRLFVYDLVQRAELANWLVVPPDPQSLVGIFASGRMLAIGPGKIAVQVETVYKGIWGWRYELYVHPSLN